MRQAKFDLSCGQEHADVSARQQWQKLFLQHIVPLISQALSQWQEEQANGSQPDFSRYHLAVSKLILDIGDFPLGDFNGGGASELSVSFQQELLVKHFKRQIDEQLIENPGQVYSLPNWQHKCYSHFLRKGYWPSGSAFSKISQVEEFYQQVDNQALKQLFKTLVKYRYRADLWSRIAYQHNKKFIEYLAKQWLSVEQFFQIQELTNKYLIGTSFYPVSTLLFAVLVKASSKASETSVANFSIELTTLESLLKTMSVEGNNNRQLKVLLNAVQASAKLEVDDSFDLADVSDSTSSLQGDEQEKNAIESTLVSQAGVILLHPFLTDLFSQCGWLKAKQFVSQQAQFNAMYALHYAATGSCSAQENELLVYKFLLGIPLLAPVPRKIILNDEIKKHIDDLLLAVIQHWSALKNTSIDGLRQSFLQRAGSIQVLDEGYRLTVEKQSIDILLERLPWTYNLIVLPWLKQPVFVSWA